MGEDFHAFSKSGVRGWNTTDAPIGWGKSFQPKESTLLSPHPMTLQPGTGAQHDRVYSNVSHELGLWVSKPARRSTQEMVSILRSRQIAQRILREKCSEKTLSRADMLRSTRLQSTTHALCLSFRSFLHLMFLCCCFSCHYARPMFILSFFTTFYVLCFVL